MGLMPQRRRGLPGQNLLSPRMQLAQQMIQQGTSGAPVLHPVQGIARLAQAFVGSRVAEQARLQQINQRQEAMRAMLQGMNAQPFVDPDTGQVAPGQRDVGGLAGAFTAVSGLQDNPFAAEMAGQLGQMTLANRLSERQRLLDEEFRRQRDDVTFDRQRQLTQMRLDAQEAARNRVLTPEQLQQQVQIAAARASQPSQGFMIDPDNPMRQIPIPGGPQDPQTQAAQETAQLEARADVERRERFPAAQQAMQGLERRTQTLLNAIDRALGVPAEGDQPAQEGQIGPLTTGFTGNLLAETGGTPQFDLAETLRTIQANIGFEELQRMREASPTGGALGQVSEMENRLLQALQGSLAQGQSEDQLRANLQAIRDNLTVVQQERRRAFQQDFADQIGTQGDQGQAAPQGAALPEGVTEDDIQETMRANDMTREQVLEEMRRRGMR